MKETLRTIEKNVLLIVELQEIEKKLKKTLANFKQVFLAHNIEDAKQVLSEKSIDTIIIDLKYIQEEKILTEYLLKIFKGIIIVVLDKVNNKEVLRIYDMGIDDFISVKCQPEELERIILLAYKKRKTDSIFRKIESKINTLQNIF